MVQPAVAASVIAGIVVFFAAPAGIAYARQHPERRTIARLSVFALFSFLLWTALLVWAVSDKRDDGVIAGYVARLRGRKLLPYVIASLVAIGAVGSAVTFLR